MVRGVNQCIVWALSLGVVQQGVNAAEVTIAADGTNVVVDTLATGLQSPWSLAFLPDGRFLVTEKPGNLRLFSADGRRSDMIRGLPAITARGQGGLLDVVVHPDFVSNQRVYLSYVAAGEGGVGTEVLRARLKDTELTEPEVIFRLARKSPTGHHFGSRLVFDPNGFLYVTLGDRGEMDRAQDLSDHAGSVIRLHDDGRVPADNPYASSPAGQLPEIYSYGHRNLQGAFWHPLEQRLWTHEHGPQGGDELNAEVAGQNYGWPVITYGVNYGSGIPIGEGTHKAGMQQPLYSWVPSIAPSGMTYYQGAMFPQWQGDIFIGSLKFQTLVRLDMAGRTVRSEDRLLTGRFGRIRDVRSAADGSLYLLTDSATDGKILRLSTP